MSVSTDQKIAASYVAFFNRAPEQGGLDYWRAEAASSGLSDLDLMKELAAGFSQHPSFASMYGNLSNSAFIDAIYVNVGGAPADAAGKAYWLAELAGGMSRSDFVASFVYGLLELDRDQLSSMLASGEISQQEFDNAVLRQDRMMNKAEVALLYTETMGAKSNLADWTDPLDPASLADDKAYQAAVAIIANVTELDSTKVQPVGLLAGNPSVTYLLDQLVGDGDARVFTLKEAYSEGISGTPPVTAVYWGYKPNGQDDPDFDPNEGIPVSELLSFLTTITGLDLAELGLIDDDGVGPFDNVTNLELKIGEVDVEDSGNVSGGNGTGGNLTIYFADGTSKNAEVELGSEYFSFLNNLLFDAEGNSRLFEKVIVPGTEGYAGELISVVLTPDQNNGGTVEPSHLRTTNGDDTIVAGRLELLHGAHIDAGEGYNILEVDAKGVFAQPKQLLNIQEVRVNNLPNVYTYVEEYGSGDSEISDGYPDWYDQDKGAYANSILDLSRATSIEKLIVTESSFDGFDYTDSPGSLTIAGIRNGATARLEGAFTEDLYLHYGQGLTGPLTVELLIGQITADLNFAHNTDALHLVSLGGSANSFGSEDLGGRLTNLKISGDAALYINGDLDSSFQDETPITIDASENTGGVDLNLGDSEQVTFIGSSGNDRLVVDTDFADEENDGDQNFDNDQYVNIIGGEGDNSYTVETYKLTGTNGDGNNNYEFEAIKAELTLGDGDNHLEGHTVNFNAVVGDGDNRFDIEAFDSPQSNVWSFIDDLDTSVTIQAGNGKNVINVYANSQTLFADGDTESSFFNGHYLKPASINITAGNGGNTILIPALPFNDEDDVLSTVDITTGTGNDNIFVGGSEIKIASGGGNDVITLLGVDRDYAWDEYDTDTVGEQGDLGNYVPGDPETFTGGAVLDIDTGAGAARINLGNYAGSGFNYSGQNGVIIAKEGSSITGENITLFVNTYANLIAAELNGVTSVILDDDAFGHTGAPKANDDYDGDRAFITLTDQQFAAIGADNFSVQGAIFNTHAFVKIIVTESTSLTALGVDDLPRNIDLYLEIQDGVTLTMTAEQLHTRVARDGITLSQDGNTDYAAGKVVITGGGTNFDPFNESDTIQTVINGNIYYGGSLSNDFKVGDAWYNVVVNSVVGGYDRPADAVVEVVLTIDSDVQSEIGAFATWHSNLEIVGEQDVDFTGPIQLGMNLGNPLTPFTIDFSSLEGVVNNFVVDNFELLAQGGGIYGNSNAGYDSEVLISIAADEGNGSGDSHTSANFGWDEDNASSLVSQGVTQYTVVQIDGPTAAGSEGRTATIQLCDTVEDLEVIALRGNWNDTLNIVDAAWGLAFELQGGGTAKAEGPTGTSNVGALVANYEWEGADAVVSIIHSVAGDTRPIYAAGIDIDNADSIAINAEGPAVIIEEIDGDDVSSVTFTAEGDVTVNEELPNDVVSIDASGVVGSFFAAIDNPSIDELTGTFSFVGGQGGSVLHLMEFTAGANTTIDGGVGGGQLNIGGIGESPDWAGDDDVDLTAATLTNINTVALHHGANLSVTMDQADTIGAENFVLGADAQLALPGPVATLNLVGLSDELFAIANYPQGVAITLTLAELPIVTLNPLTDLTGINGLIIPEGTTLFLTMDQFQQLNGTGTLTGLGSVVITDVTQASVGENGEDLDLDLVDLTGDDSTVTLNLVENVNLTEADLVDAGNPTVDTFNIGTFILTLGDINVADGVAVIGGAGSTLKFTDISEPILSMIDAGGFDVDFLEVEAALVADNNIDFMFDNLIERVTKVIVDDFGQVIGREQNLVIKATTTVPGDLSVNDYGLNSEVTTLNVTLGGGALLDGDLIVSTVTPDPDLVGKYLQELNIISEGTEANTISGETDNVITGDITPLSPFPGYDPDGPGGEFGEGADNNLKLVNITATQNLVIGGDIIFSSHGSDGVGEDEPDDGITANDDNNATVTLNIGGTADVTVEQLDMSDEDIGSLVINNTGTGTLTVTGASPAIVTGDDSESVIITGTGDVVLSDTLSSTSNTTVDSDSLSLFDASGHSGLLAAGEFVNVDDADFSFIAGSGVTTLLFKDEDLDSTGIDTIAGNANDTAGWTFDFSNAAAGSTFHFAPAAEAFVAGSNLTIDMGANAVLYIDTSMDLSDLDLSIISGQAIVIADGATLVLSAEQADGLTIIGENGADSTGVVNIVNLNEEPVDLSGISEDVAGVATLELDNAPPGTPTPGDNEAADVTLDVLTDLGFFAIQLEALSDADDILSGQTIRFTTVEQADGREVLVVDNVDGNAPGVNTVNSTNVVWLFENLNGGEPIDTSGYFEPGAVIDGGYQIGRLWLNNLLIANEGGNIEDLFTTLPTAIIRAEFASVDLLDALLSAAPVDRIFEVVSFLDLGDISFNDTGLDPDEFIKTLTIKMGGQSSIASITLDDEIAPNTDPASVQFNKLTIESHRALSDDYFLATEFYTNNNDGTITLGENIAPVALNTIGDIGTGSGLELENVEIDTLNDTTDNPGVDSEDIDSGSVVGDDPGAEIEIGTITYASNDGGTIVNLTVSGQNDVTIASVNTADTDIVGIATVNNLSLGATLIAPGASPAFNLDNTEGWVLTGAGHMEAGSATNAGVVGNELSLIDASASTGNLDFGIVADIDGNADLAEDFNGDGDTTDTDLYEGANEAFEFKSGSGITTMTLGTANGRTPELEAGNTWTFDYTIADGASSLTITEDVIFQPTVDSLDPTTLVLIDVPVVIDGSVDLSEIYVNADATTTFFVAEGNTLTLTIQQALDLTDIGVHFFGEGTVKIIGNGTNLDLDTNAFRNNMDVVNIDLSGVTLDTDDDVNDIFVINVGSAQDDDDDQVGHNVVGSPNDDEIDGGVDDDTLTGGAGDDTLIGGGGDDTYIVDAGTDTITDPLVNDGTDGDVLVVSAGATANATVDDSVGDFIATAATINDGTATITGADSQDNTINVAAAGGANGFTLVGGNFGDELTGSNQDDVINGGLVQAADQRDWLTGNGGADIFVFAVEQSTPIALDQETTTDGEDYELWQFDTEGFGFTGDADGAQGLTVFYRNNETATSFTINDDATIDFTDGDALGARVASELSSRGVAASYVAASSQLSLSGTPGQFVEITQFDPAGTGAWDGAAPAELGAGAGSDADDEFQVTEVTVATGTAVAGEIYSITVALAGGNAYVYEFTAVGGEDQDAIATALRNGIDGLDPGAEWSVSVTDNVITITDTDDDNGGFTVVLDNNPGISGTGASALGAGAGVWADADADVITDFVSGVDSIKLFADGTNANYLEAAAEADYADAYAAADAAMNGTVRYYLTSATDLDGTPGSEQIAGQEGAGLLFFDANGDSNIDGVIVLIGINQANFDEQDIIA